MSLAAQQDPPKIAYHARGCQLGRWAATLSTEERAGLDALLAPDSGWTHKAIAQRITADPDYPGVRFNKDAVAYHRNGECACEPR